MDTLLVLGKVFEMWLKVPTSWCFRSYIPVQSLSFELLNTCLELVMVHGVKPSHQPLGLHRITATKK
jgi:hypothetical protein